MSDGNVFNLLVQEYRLHCPVPLIHFKPVVDKAPWPEFGRLSEKSTESLSCPEMSLRYGDVSFNQTGTGLGGNEIPPKVCGESPRWCGKEPQEADERHGHPSLKEKGVCTDTFDERTSLDGQMRCLLVPYMQSLLATFYVTFSPNLLFLITSNLNVLFFDETY